MSEPLFDGHPDRECGEHRTLGRRAWCHDCSEYCYPGTGGCKGCELPYLRESSVVQRRLVKGYTAKVGLRKPGTWEWVVRNQVRPLRIKVRAGSLCASAGLVDTIRQAMDTVEALEHPAVVKRHWTGQRARLEDLCSGPHPHCTCAYSTECCHCGDGQVHG